MSASVHGEGDRQGLRLVLSFILAMSLYEIVKYVFLLPPPDEQLPWSPTWLVTINDMVWPVVVLLVFAAIGVLGFARGKRAQLVFGLLTLVCLAVLVEVLGAHVNQHRRRFYSVGATLLGWLLGLIVGRLRGADEARSERLAEAGAMAGLAATYCNAGIQKIMSGGLFETYSLPGYIYTHHHVDDSSPIGMLAFYVATHPKVAMTIALSIVVVQLGAWTTLMSQRMRMIWGALLISFHLGTLVFLHIIYFMATILLLAWCFPWARWMARVRGRPPPAELTKEQHPPLDRRTLTIMVVAAGVFVGVASVVPVPHPRATYGEPPDFPPRIYVPPPDPPPPPVLTKVGPLALGEPLADWIIGGLEVRDAVLRIELQRGEQRVRFGVSGPAGDAPPGPHSVGDLHIFYDADEGLELAEFDEAGAALRERLVGQSEQERAGASVDAWIEAARPHAPSQ